MQFAIPSACADLLRTGAVDIGLVPVIELERQALEIVPPLGIASSGPVRSILLISKTPAAEIRTLAADASSRTSVVLGRILLDRQYGAKPAIVEAAPDVAAMLRVADACLVIGDPALRVALDQEGVEIHDLGQEWTAWSGLPMVYAVWAARAGFAAGAVQQALADSYAFGRERLDAIAAAESGPRGIPEALARAYLARNIEFEMSDNHWRGLAHFRQIARTSGLV